MFAIHLFFWGKRIRFLVKMLSVDRTVGSYPRKEIIDYILATNLTSHSKLALSRIANKFRIDISVEEEKRALNGTLNILHSL